MEGELWDAVGGFHGCFGLCFFCLHMFLSLVVLHILVVLIVITVLVVVARFVGGVVRLLSRFKMLSWLFLLR